MQRIYNLRSPVKVLVSFWSVTTVLRMLKLWSPNDKLDLKHLTYKTIMLLALVTAKRCSSLSLLTLNEGYCEIGESSIKFQPFGLEKMSRDGHVASSIEIEQFKNPDIGPVACIKMYINKTENLRTNNTLFITLQKLHKMAQKVTLANWIKSVIVMSGQTGTGGSSRSAASSRAIG